MPKLRSRSKRKPVTQEDSPLGLIKRRVTTLNSLLGKVVPVPDEWLTGANTGLKTGSSLGGVTPVECTSYRKLVSAGWRKALKWTTGLDYGLSTMLASVISTNSVGDQLWVKIIGPPACGKTTLCEAISVSKQYVIAKSTIRGFHSGFKTDSSGSEDNSLISQLYGKTLVTKDGDTLLQSPNLGQILSEARDLYDSTARTHYRNKMSREYEGVRMTWILCGTSSLRSIDSSELGERFLDCIIVDGVDEELEDEILQRVVRKSFSNVGTETNGDIHTQYDENLLLAMQMTGGYVNYLREKVAGDMGSIDVPTVALTQCINLGKFVAYMRARPSRIQDESAEREFATRVTSQLARLAKCTAAVLNKHKVDSEVMSRVRKVALDTSRGKGLQIAKLLYESEDGLGIREAATKSDYTEYEVGSMLRFMRKIKATRTTSKNVKGVRAKLRWKLTENVEELYRRVMHDMG